MEWKSTISFNVSSNQLEDRLTAPNYFAKHILSEISKRIPVVSLGKIGDPVSGSYIDEYVEKGLLYLRAQNIRRYNIDLNNEDVKYIASDHPDIKNKMKVIPGDVLITRTGLYLGSACVAPDDVKDSVISQHLTRFVAREINPHYITVILNSSIGRLQIDAKSAGMTRPELTHASLRSIQIPLLSDQAYQKAMRKLENANSKRVSARKLICSAVTRLEKELGFGVFRDPEKIAFTTSSQNVADLFTPMYYYPPFCELEKQFLARNRTVELAKISSKIMRGNEIGSNNYWQAGIPFIRTTDIINNEIDDYPDFYASADLLAKLHQDVKVGDILFTNDGKIGLSAIVTEHDRFIYQSHIRRIRMRNFGPEFVFAFLNTNVAKCMIQRRIVVQATIPTLSNRLGDIPIPLLAKDFTDEISATIAEAVGLLAEAKRLVKTAIGRINNEISLMIGLTEFPVLGPRVRGSR